MKIRIILGSKYKSTVPFCHIESKHSHGQIFLEGKETVFESDFDMGGEDYISITFSNKDDADNNVVYIKKISVDEIDMHHFIYKGEFKPNYNKDWYEKQDPRPPLTYSPCTELRHNGTWSLKVNTPIWKTIMENWIQDEK